MLASRLATYFSDIKETKEYLEKVNYTNSETILWSFQDKQKPNFSSNVKPTIAISYNAEVGGTTTNAVKNRVTEQDGNVISIDYRKIIPLNSNDQSLKKILEAGKAQAKKLLQNIDGLIIPGNSDAVYPELFDSNENFGSTDKERSIAEIILVHTALQKGIPIIGICGGHQLINVYHGGKLANIDGLNYSNVTIIEDSELARIIANPSPQNFWASHHQIVSKIGNLDFINAVAYVGYEIVATESEYGVPIKTFQFHIEMKNEQTEVELERNNKIFKEFIKTCNSYKVKKISLNAIPKVITKSDADNSESKILVEKLHNFKAIIREISSKSPTNKYSTLDEVEANSKLLQQININNIINRDTQGEEIKLLKAGMTSETFLHFIEDCKLIKDFNNIDRIQNFDNLSTDQLVNMKLFKLFKLFVENSRNVKSLQEIGIAAEQLLSMDDAKQELFIKNVLNIKSLQEIGIAAEQLLTMDDTKQKLFITNSFNIKSLKETGIDMEQLLTMDDTKQKLFITNSFNIKILQEIGIAAEQLLSMDDAKQELFIKNVLNIKILQEIGIAAEQLLTMNFDQQQLFIKNEYEELLIRISSETGLSREQLLYGDECQFGGLSSNFTDEDIHN